MKVIEINSDSHVWAEVPLEYPAGPFANQGKWAKAVAKAFSQDEADPRAAYRAILSVARVMPAASSPGLFSMFWYLRDPLRTSLIARVYVAPMQEEQASAESLKDVAGASNPDAVETPDVVAVASPVFGTVYNVSARFRSPESGKELLRLTTIGTRDGTTVMLEAVSSDVEYVASARDDVVALMMAVSLTDSP